MENIVYKGIVYNGDEKSMKVNYTINGKEKSIKFLWNQHKKIQCVDEKNVIIELSREDINIEKKDLIVLTKHLLCEVMKEYGLQIKEDRKKGIIREFYWEYDTAQGLIDSIMDYKFETMLKRENDNIDMVKGKLVNTIKQDKVVLDMVREVGEKSKNDKLIMVEEVKI